MIDIVRNNIQLWAIQLVPALLPYMIISVFILKLSYRYIPICNNRIINPNNHSYKLSLTALFIFFAGHLCGYPVGAKLVTDAYNNNNLSEDECNFLISVCNQSSPAFIQFYVGEYILNGIIPSWSIYIVFYISSIMTAILMKLMYLNSKKIINTKMNKSFKNKTSLITILDDCITESCITILKVGGYIVIFSLVSHLLFQLLPNSFKYLSILLSTIEITTGLLYLKSFNIKYLWYIPMVLSLTAFGGFCTMSQIKGMLTRTPLSIKPYIIGKIIYMIIVFIISLLFIQIKIIRFNF